MLAAVNQLQKLRSAGGCDMVPRCWNLVRVDESRFEKARWKSDETPHWLGRYCPVGFTLWQYDADTGYSIQGT